MLTEEGVGGGGHVIAIVMGEGDSTGQQEQHPLEGSATVALGGGAGDGESTGIQGGSTGFAAEDGDTG